jgi:hypothetical protein
MWSLVLRTLSGSVVGLPSHALCSFPATHQKAMCKYEHDYAVICETCNFITHYCHIDRLCGLVVSVADYKHRGPGFDSRALLRIFLRELGLWNGVHSAS